MITAIFSGLIHSSAYALVAVGMTLVFGVTNVANFAQGSLVALGMMVAWWGGSALGLGFIPTVLLVIIITASVGFLMNFIVIAPLEGRKPIAALLATIGVGQIIDHGLQLVFGTQTRQFPKLLETYNYELFGIRFGTSDVVMFLVTIVLMIGMWLFLKNSKIGQAIRATSQDPQAAAQMGIPVVLIRHISFVIGAVLAGVAGIFVGLYNVTVNPMNGSSIGMTAFVAATIGGLGSIPGAVIGGVVLGVIESIGIFWFGDGVRDIITFGALLLVLIIRPQGLLGNKDDATSEPLTGTFLGGGRPLVFPVWVNALLVTLLLVSPFIANNYIAGVGTQIAVYAIAAVGLTMISGSAGQTILGMAGPVAVGAYASALLTKDFAWPFLLAMLFAGIIAAVAACLLTFPVWKLSGHYVAIATIGVGAVMVAFIRIADPITRGSLGIAGISAPNVFGLELDTVQKQYLFDVIVLLITLFIVNRIRKSHVGQVFEGIGSDKFASQSLAIHTGAYKALAYALASFFAGISGSLLAHQYSYIDPTNFTSNMSILILTIIVLGGMNSPLGAVLGSVVLVGAPELLRVTADARIFVYGILLVVIILLKPQGLFAKKV
ncbi:MAG: ABC transporter permease [Bifidobacteriaceae bacterium]|nr:ABC transporter permease [Bifidobacteriaceae bacterium]